MAYGFRTVTSEARYHLGHGNVIKFLFGLMLGAILAVPAMAWGVVTAISNKKGPVKEWRRGHYRTFRGTARGWFWG